MTLLFLFILGASVGSFLNVLSDRLSHDLSMNGRSHCEFCHKTLGWFDLIPIFSFLQIKGRCRYCDKKLSWTYWLAEVGTGLSFVAVWLYAPKEIFNFHPPAGGSIFDENFKFLISNYTELGIYLVIVSILIAIFLSDVKYHIIPDQLVMALSIISIAFILIHPLDSLAGAGALTGILGFFWFITKGKGMGFGDVKFAIPMGLILGFIPGLIALYIAFVLGGVLGIIAILLKLRKMKSQIAFGPFLIMGMIMMLFFHEQILYLFSHVATFF